MVAQAQTGATIGDDLGYQQWSQYQLLLGWLREKFAEGHNVDEVEAVLAAQLCLKSARKRIIIND